jgi:hypothetical protein
MKAKFAGSSVKSKAKKASAVKGPAKKLASLKRSRQRKFVAAMGQLPKEEVLEYASVFPVRAKGQVLGWPKL